MADEATTPSAEPAAPVQTAPTPPAADQVTIGLGPDLQLYPEELRPPATTPTAPTPPSETLEPGPTEPSESPPAAGPAEQSPQGSRRRANEEAYQRGLSEGRAAIEREYQQRVQQQQWDQTQREANQRVEQLFAGLESPDYATQDRARRGILQMYRGNQQAQALMTTTRQQVLAEMAADFGKLKDLDGIADADYQQLHTAPSAAELAKRAYDLGKKARDEQVARLEAELQGLRGRLVGSRATPEAANGASGGPGGMTIEQYRALTPRDARRLSSAQIDQMTALMAAEAQQNAR